MSSTGQDIRNHLAVAVAWIEAFIDGKLVPTPARLDAVLQALYALDVLLNDVPAAADAPATRLRTASEPSP